MRRADVLLAVALGALGGCGDGDGDGDGGGTSDAAAAEAGDGGAQATDGAGRSGSDGASANASVTCALDASTSGGGGGDPSIAATVEGLNGIFSDTCTTAGDLTEYACETALRCGPGPNPDCTSYETGQVIPSTVDCAGHCAGGRCDGRCPTFQQSLRFVSIDTAGNPVLDNMSDGRRYACTLTFDSGHDAFDCKTGPKAGSSATINSLGLHGTFCTGADFGGFGVRFDGVATTDNESCSYACSIPR